MDWIIYTLIFLLVMLALVWLYIGLYVAMTIVTPTVRTLEQTEDEENQRDDGLMVYYHQHITDDYTIKSLKGYKLYVYEMILNPSIKKFVVISHGYTYSHHGSIKYAKMMTELGYNVVMYDHRFHGKSGGKNATLGYYESMDLKTVIDHIFKTYGSNIFLGTYGESMGSATCLVEQANDSRVKFVVTDAGFKDLKVLIKHRLKVQKLSPILFYGVANFFVWLISGSSLSQVRPIDAIKSSQIPIFFIHGKQDDFIPYQHAIDMYDAYHGPKKMYIADGNAYHARSYYADKKRYFRELSNFMKDLVNH
ncbi:MAG TPA: alpha/beta fold hydrolase [Candidatus Izemoplasmatales bacterium]|nr:alpha/beta fold hydrolase [Candidatus Izemoplasmatales bacterium]